MKSIYTKLLATAVVTTYAFHSNAGLFSSSPRVEEGITFGTDLPAGQVDAILGDLKFLKETKLRISDEKTAKEFQRIFKIDPRTDASAALLGWLKERVKYVVSEKSDLEENMVDLGESKYPNNEKADIEIATKTPNSSSTEKVVMNNISGPLYYAGKQDNVLLGYKVSGVEEPIPLRSPRAGILRVGEGLFSKLTVHDTLRSDSKIYSIWRLGSLFHEARHSDGNGKHVAFLHTACPEGHELAGYPACDNNLNGSYSVQYYFLQLVLSSCEAKSFSCDENDKAAMKLMAKEAYGNILQTHPFSEKDRSEIKNGISSLNIALGKCGQPDAIPKFCENIEATKATIKQLEALLANPPATFPNRDWKDAPEKI